MNEDLERLVQTAEGHAPSDEFVARLRSQIVAETEGSGVATDNGLDGVAAPPPGSAVDAPGEHDDITVVVDLEPEHSDELAARRLARTRRLRVLSAAAASVVVVLIGVWALTSGSGDDDPDSQLDTVDTPTTIEAPDPDERGSPLTAGNTGFDAGTHRIDTLGTAFTFDVEETTGLLLNENARVSITDLTSRNADDRTITFRRTSLLPDPAALTARLDPATGWPATDVVGWLDRLGDEATASTPLATTLGGLKATFVEIELRCSQTNCVAGDPLADPDLPVFTSGSRYQMWVVDQGEEDPIVVIVAIDDDDDIAWLDEADGILDSLEFESIAANPVRRATAGTTALAVFDGISVELFEETVVVEPFDGFARMLPPNIGGDVEFLTRPLDIGGVEVTTTERLLQLLEDEAVKLTEVDTPDVGGFTARTFEVESGPFPNIVLKARAADLVRTEFGWEPPHGGHLWIVEHPDRGLLIVSNEALVGPEVVEPLRSWTEEILESLDFI
ncbi:MAG: hypothetical protein ACR2P0_10430 [Acidimicrobiales bacterium]